MSLQRCVIIVLAGMPSRVFLYHWKLKILIFWWFCNVYFSILIICNNFPQLIVKSDHQSIKLWGQIAKRALGVKVTFFAHYFLPQEKYNVYAVMLQQTIVNEFFSKFVDCIKLCIKFYLNTKSCGNPLLNFSSYWFYPEKLSQRRKNPPPWKLIGGERGAACSIC